MKELSSHSVNLIRIETAGVSNCFIMYIHTAYHFLKTSLMDIRHSTITKRKSSDLNASKNIFSNSSLVIPLFFGAHPL